MVRRINIFGGCGVGKSTLASQIYCNLKRKEINCELVTEYVKKWAYENKKPQGFDQLYVFAKQIHAEELYLKNNVDVIVTDCPVLLSYVYSKAYNLKYANEILRLIDYFNKEYDSLNILLKRNVKYNPVGRFQNEEEAKEIDDLVFNSLKENNYKFHVFYVDQQDEIMSLVDSVLYSRGSGG